MLNVANWIITDAQGNLIINPNNYFDLAATGLNEVLQNIRVIMTTRVGQVQLDRRLGMRYNFVDAPINIAELLIVTEVCEALTHFEPRATFKRIQFAPSVTNPGELDVKLAVNIDQSELSLPNG